MVDTAKRKFAFVLPRFGKGFAGGAEFLSGQLATHLARAGDQVEILTTCAVDNRTWENELPAGVEELEGVTVRRFPVGERNLDIWIPIQISISEGMRPGVEQQLDWMENSVVSPELFDFIQKYNPEYDALFFAPYLFGLTFWGSLIAPEQSILIPCLHDEHYAYLDVIASMFKQVAGAMFNARAEKELAQRLYGPIAGGEVGLGFSLVQQAEVDRLKPYFEEEFPYLLYLGRKETGKNVQLLVDYFIELKDSGTVRSDLKLVVLGGGSFDDLDRGAALRRDDILDLPFVSEEEKKRILKHAVACCQPSVNESFSIVIMEGWQVGTPALVHGRCAVTREHVVESGGGLYFANEEEFIETVKTLIEDRELNAKLAAAGAKYVREKYNWNAVLSRFEKSYANIIRHPQRSEDLQKVD